MNTATILDDDLVSMSPQMDTKLNRVTIGAADVFGPLSWLFSHVT